MRFWYQSMAREEAIASTQHHLDGMAPQLERIAGPGSEVHFEDITRRGGSAIFWRFYEFLDTRDAVANALHAQREGHDAFLIENIADPGLYEARQIVDIPVPGVCKSICHTACMIGRLFAMVSIYKKFNTRILNQIERCGLKSRFIGMYQMPGGSAAMPGAMGGGSAGKVRCAEVVEQFVMTARKTIADGAEVLIAAGGLVMVLLAREGMGEVDGAPVLDSTTALIKMGRGLPWKCIKATCSFTRRVLTFHSPTEFLDEIAAAYCGEAGKAVFATRPAAKPAVNHSSNSR